MKPQFNIINKPVPNENTSHKQVISMDIKTNPIGLRQFHSMMQYKTYIQSDIESKISNFNDNLSKRRMKLGVDEMYKESQLLNILKERKNNQDGSSIQKKRIMYDIHDQNNVNKKVSSQRNNITNNEDSKRSKYKQDEENRKQVLPNSSIQSQNTKNSNILLDKNRSKLIDNVETFSSQTAESINTIEIKSSFSNKNKAQNQNNKSKRVIVTSQNSKKPQIKKSFNNIKSTEKNTKTIKKDSRNKVTKKIILPVININETLNNSSEIDENDVEYKLNRASRYQNVSFEAKESNTLNNSSIQHKDMKSIAIETDPDNEYSLSFILSQNTSMISEYAPREDIPKPIDYNQDQIDKNNIDQYNSHEQIYNVSTQKNNNTSHLSSPERTISRKQLEIASSPTDFLKSKKDNVKLKSINQDISFSSDDSSTSDQVPKRKRKLKKQIQDHAKRVTSLRNSLTEEIRESSMSRSASPVHSDRIEKEAIKSAKLETASPSKTYKSNITKDEQNDLKKINSKDTPFESEHIYSNNIFNPGQMRELPMHLGSFVEQQKKEDEHNLTDSSHTHKDHHSTSLKKKHTENDNESILTLKERLQQSFVRSKRIREALWIQKYGDLLESESNEEISDTNSYKTSTTSVVTSISNSKDSFKNIEATSTIESSKKSYLSESLDDSSSLDSNSESSYHYDSKSTKLNINPSLNNSNSKSSIIENNTSFFPGIGSNNKNFDDEKLIQSLLESDEEDTLDELEYTLEKQHRLLIQEGILSDDDD